MIGRELGYGRQLTFKSSRVSFLRKKKKYLETNILIAKNAYNVFVRDLLGLFGNAKSGTLYGTQSQKSYLFQILANPRH